MILKVKVNFMTKFTHLFTFVAFTSLLSWFAHFSLERSLKSVMQYPFCLLKTIRCIDHTLVILNERNSMLK